MEVWFTARRKFGPSFGVEWEKYIQWANLPQLHEVVSLDAILCPDMFEELMEEDWRYNIQEDYRTSFFRDLDHVARRMRAKLDLVNIMAVIYEPVTDPVAVFQDDRFEFCGFDLAENEGDISALNNCGGFEKAFDNPDISKLGLLDDYQFARDVQKKIRENYPDEHHANPSLWAIWRLKKLDNPNVTS